MQQLVISTKRRKATRGDDFDQISNSLVATTTCLTATNWPKDILKQFDIVCIDEAAFAPRLAQCLGFLVICFGNR